MGVWRFAAKGKSMEVTISTTLSKLNDKHQRFWSERDTFLEQRMGYFELAYQLKFDESWLPIYYRPSLERMLERAEEVTKVCHKLFSKKGARAAKPDPLHRLIFEKVERDPTISEPDLLRQLKGCKGISPIQEITEEEIILDTGKVVPLTGLKDRLSRAKKIYRGEKTKEEINT
jgi:hypothetical protein